MNYKSWGHNVFSLALGYYWNFNSDRDTVIWLRESGSTIDIVSLHNMRNDVAYVVPSGKKLMITNIVKYLDASRTVDLGQSNSVDTGSGFTNIVDKVHGDDMDARYIYFEVEAGKYVTANSSGANTWEIIVSGIETDA